MVLPQLSSFFASRPDVDPRPSQQVGLDSITLGQLKAMVSSAPKPKVGTLPTIHSSRLTPANK